MTNSSHNETTKAPIARLRIGLVNASIWQRTHGDGVFYSVSFERRYNDSNGEWQATHSYDADDLLALAKLADQAHTKITELRAGRDH